MSQRTGHVPVLVEEVLAALRPRAGGEGVEGAGETYLDCTAGLGGHAAAVAERMRGVGGVGTVVLNDADPANLAAAAARVREVGDRAGGGAGGCRGGLRVEAVRGNFAEAPRAMEEMGLAADMVLADLGFSSNQMEDAGRGLSFGRDGPLDMRLDPTLGTTAADLVASLSEGELAGLLREFGEEQEAGRIARKLVAARRGGPISTTGQLAELVRAAKGGRLGQAGIDPATKTFQALRIAVNDELGSLDALLSSVIRGAKEVGSGRRSWLRAGARVAVVSFHSLEDRMVKRAFGRMVAEGLAEDLTGGAVSAGGDEVRVNPRSRSAKLRAVRVVGAGE